MGIVMTPPPTPASADTIPAVIPMSARRNELGTADSSSFFWDCASPSVSILIPAVTTTRAKAMRRCLPLRMAASLVVTNAVRALNSPIRRTARQSMLFCFLCW
jgi:hypothetical protein